MGRKFNFLREAVGTILDVWDILSIATGIGGGFGAVLVEWLAEIPFYYPLILVIISIGFISYGTIKTIISYKKWLLVRDVPLLDDVMKKELELHLHLGKTQELVVQKNAKRQVNTKTINNLVKKYLETIGFSDDKILLRSLNPDGTLNKYGYKRLKRIYHLKDNEYFSILPLLKGYSKVLNRSKLGLKSKLEDDGNYDQLNSELLELQLKINLPEDDIRLLTELKSLSYGLYDLSIGIRLINENRVWYKLIPEPYIDMRDEMAEMIEDIYIRVSSRVRLQLKRAMLKGGVI